MTDASSKILQDAHRVYAEGFRRRAERLCRRIPAGDIHRAEALCLLAAIQIDDGRRAEAQRTADLATGASLATAGAFAGLGAVLERLGRRAAAASAFRRLQLLDPGSVVGAFSAGNMLRALGDVDAARRSYGRARVMAPVHPNIANNLGTLSFGQSEWVDAATWFRAATRLEPQHVPAIVNLARTLKVLLQEEDAAAQFGRALILDPTNLSAWCELSVLRGQARWASWAVALNPVDPEPHLARARLATADDPERSLLHLRRGACLQPENAAPWNNIGVAFERRGIPRLAARYGARATRIDRRFAGAQYTTALALLALERFEEGWERHRWRLATEEFASSRRRFAIPEWVGQSLAGKRVLLWREQGIGDEVMFLTLAHALSGRGAGVTALTDPRMRPIVARSFPGWRVPDVGPPTGEIEDHHRCDYHVAVGDLAHRFGVFCGGEVAPRPWLTPDPDRVAGLRAALTARHSGRPLVGITWRSAAARTGTLRTIPIPVWRDVVNTPGVAFVSLQYGLEPGDLQAFEASAGQAIDHAHGVEPLDDLDGLAALIAAMDLVISPANNTVQFAGAMAKACWTLIPAAPDWRWGLDRDDTLWFPSMRVLRQERAGDWAPVMARVAADLRAWAAARPSDG